MAERDDVSIRRSSPRRLVPVVLCVILASSSIVLTSASDAFAATCGSWIVQTSPNVSPSAEDNLFAASAIEKNDAWAVGEYLTQVGTQGVHRTLAEHYAGSTPGWSLVSTPNPANGQDAFLRGVTSIASNDAWAVGDYSNSVKNSPLAEHWNGSSWSLYTSLADPTSTSQTFLTGTSAVSSTDVFAVGYYSSDVTYPDLQPITYHWNGTTWTAQLFTNPGDTAFLSGVTAIASNDVWAVGGYNDATLSGVIPYPLVLHYSGSPPSWHGQTLPQPIPGAKTTYFNSVDAVSSTDVWAVGQTDTLPFIEHYDGTSWSVVTGASIPSPQTPTLVGVAAASAKDVWAVGQNGVETLSEHYDGTSWSVVPSQNPGGTSNDFDGIAALPNGDVWAVGLKDSVSTLVQVNNCAFAGAQANYVSVTNGGFDPASITSKQGATVQWNFFGPSANSVTDGTGLSLFSSGTINPVDDFRFAYRAAGTYSVADALSHKGTVKVPAKASPKTGNSTTTFTITWASASPPAGDVFDVQIAYCTSTPCTKTFSSWKSGVTSQSASFGSSNPSWQGAGSYFFRGRLRNPSTAKASKYSTAVAIVVS